MYDLPILNHTYRECGFKLPRTNNVGGSGDWKDLFYLTDYLTFVLDHHFESQPCRKGCSTCCQENSVFRVTRTEWDLIRDRLESLDPTEVLGLVERTNAIYGPFRDQMEQVSKNWETADFDAENLALDGLPVGCPALSGDLCLLYEVRPLICRSYGYMAATIRGKESLLICKTYGEPFIAGLRDQGMEHVPLPNFEPFAKQLTSLNGAREVKPLPLWILEWRQSPSSESERP